MSKISIGFLLTCLVLSMVIVHVSAVDYDVGVATGSYVKLGNFAGNTSTSDLDWTKYEVTAISGTNVTMTITAVFQNGTTPLGSGTTYTYDIEKFTANGTFTPGLLIPIIPAHLTVGDEVPGAGANVSITKNRTYLGTDRIVNIVETNFITGSSIYLASLAYDGVSGIILEVEAEQIGSTETFLVSFSVVETNIFAGEVTPEFVLILLIVLILISFSIAVLVFKKRFLKKQN